MNPRILTVLVAVASLFTGTAAAQGVTFPVVCPDGGLKVGYLVETDSSVVLLCRYVPDAAGLGPAPFLMNIGRNTKVSTPDGDYALMNVRQIPFRDEADVKYAYIKGVQPALNFALEFEKFPFDDSFDLIEGGPGPASFAVSGLTVGRKEADDVDMDSFLAETPYSEYGYYYKDGEPVYYFDDGGIHLTTVADKYSNPKWDYMTFGFRVINRTGAPLNVNFKDLSVEAQRLNRRNSLIKCSCRICDAKDADAEWKDVDRLEVSNEVNTVAADIPTYIAVGASQTGGLLGDGIAVLGVLLSNAAFNAAVEPYLEERNKIREEQMQYYFKDTTLQAGDTLSTFVTIKYLDKPSSTTVSFNLNGDKYTVKY